MESSEAASDKKEAPAAGDQVLSVYANAEIKTLVQWAASDNQSSKVNNNAFEGLLRLDEIMMRSLHSRKAMMFPMINLHTPFI